MFDFVSLLQETLPQLHGAPCYVEGGLSTLRTLFVLIGDMSFYTVYNTDSLCLFAKCPTNMNVVILGGSMQVLGWGEIFEKISGWLFFLNPPLLGKIRLCKQPWCCIFVIFSNKMTCAHQLLFLSLLTFVP